MSGLPAGVTEEQLRRQLLETAHALHRRGWVANHDGNASCRLGPARLLCTPTAVSKGDVTAESLIVVDGENKVVQGTRRAFSELQLHRAAYAARPDIGVVLHAHPPQATAFAVSGKDLGHPFMAEPVVSLGPRIPVVPYHRPKDPALDAAIGAALADADVVILAQHGVLAVGGSFEQALLRLELVEHLARIAAAAAPLGGVRGLPPAEVAALSAKGRPASQPSWGATPATPAQNRTGRNSTPRGSTRRPDVAGLVDATLRRFE